MAGDIGSVSVRVAPNMSGIQGKIAAGFRGSAGPATAALGGEVNKNSGPFQSAIGRLGGFAKAGGLAVAAGMAVGAAGLVALTGKALMAGAELEQQLGGADAVFGKYASSIKNTAKSAYFEAGLSQNEFLQGANKMGSLFQGAGFSVQQSMTMSSESMQRASDIASIMGISTTSALEAVTGMAKGNFTMMDNLGVAMNDTAIGAYAASKGLDKTTASMSIQEKVGLAQQMFMEKTAKYAGNYAKENQTLAGSINSTKKAFDNLLSGQGEIDGFIELLVNSIELAVPQIVKILPMIVEGLGATLTALVPALSAALPTLIPALIEAVTSLMNALVAAMPTIVQTLVSALPAVIDAFIKIFLALVQALPQIITILSNAMPMIIDALVTGLYNPTTMMALIMAGVQLFLALVKAIPIIIVALVKALPTILSSMVKVLTSPAFINAMIRAGVELIKALVSGLISILGAVRSAAGRIVEGISRTLSPGNLARIGVDLVRGLWNGINDMAGWVKGKIDSFSQDVLNNIKDFFGIKSPSTVFAGIGRDLDRGLAQGITGNAGLVTSAVDDMTNAALAAVVNPMISPSLALGSANAAAAGGLSGNTTTSTTTIDKVILGDAGAVREFFKQANQDTINLGMGLTANQGASNDRQY